MALANLDSMSVWKSRNCSSPSRLLTLATMSGILWSCFSKSVKTLREKNSDASRSRISASSTSRSSTKLLKNREMAVLKSLSFATSSSSIRVAGVD